MWRWPFAEGPNGFDDVIRASVHYRLLKDLPTPKPAAKRSANLLQIHFRFTSDSLQIHFRLRYESGSILLPGNMNQ
ncbi:hypothetical protein VN97_g41 [Penicillium thymicola]|uniref:Uncharacterized protein n=1 Tax=Penicillium thymicola TaxID=293382 RepID=A0AAI9TV77_PENTH|nr:hypothetical protein VN97_g41 [Penicillium thymicola]